LADPVQEQSAARTELKTGRPSRQALAELEESHERLHDQRRALPGHKLKQLDDAEARIGRLTSERDPLLQTLRALPEPSPRRLLSRKRDPEELDRSRLVAAISAYDGELERALAQRARLEGELGDPEQVRSERAGLDRAIEEVNGQSARMRERLDEREREIPSRHDAVPRDRGDEVERSATRDLELGL
jgi:chromosome segregation ATPase